MKYLTKGSILKGILLFVISLLLGNFFQMFYSTVDALIVGKTIGAVAVGAIGATGSISSLIISSGQGVTTGKSLLISRYFGAKDKENVQRSFTIGLCFSVGISIVLTSLGLIFINPLLLLMQTPSSIFDLSRTFLSTIFTNLYNYLSASIRALGNSRISFVALIIANVFNAAFSAFLVMLFHLGVLGAGLATVIAQLVSVVFLAVYIVSKAKIFEFSFGSFFEDGYQSTSSDWLAHGPAS